MPAALPNFVSWRCWSGRDYKLSIKSLIKLEEFSVFKPRSEVLKKYIATFYFHKDERQHETRKIVFFPNTKNALTIYKGSSCEFIATDPKHVRIAHQESADYLFLYGGIQQNYIVSEMRSPFDKIGIVFYPLGLNYFVRDCNMGRLIRDDFFFPSMQANMQAVIASVYETHDLEERLDLLESFFMSQLSSQFNDTVLEKAIHIIEQHQGKLKVGDVAKMVNLEEKTLLRKFKNHLNCSPKHYSKVVKFRNALSAYQDIKNLTDLAYHVHYYDQSDLIKNIRELTGKKPSFFFKEINNLGHDIYWIR